jgi:methyltransferase (TIGR00027 family)
MDERRASAMAEVVAVYRAAESLKPEEQRICYDSLARHFLRRRYRLVLSSRRLAEIVLRLAVERPWPGDIGTILVRTRYIDDLVAGCLSNGISQLVILGAGYDSRAYRMEGLADRVKVFEIDHPATQAAKTATVADLFGTLPGHVTYIPLDFNRRTLSEALAASAYDPDRTTLFIWEGVTMYLERGAVEDTLRFVATNSGADSSIVFDYLRYSDRYDEEQLRMLKKNQDSLVKRGEPWTFGLPEGTVGNFVSSLGFREVVEASDDTLKDKYLTGPNQNRAMYAFLPIVHATVHIAA